MTGSNSFWFANPSSGFYNGVATQSLRFDDGSSTYLNKTFGSSGSRNKWTFSAWVKKSTLDIDGYLIGVGTGSAFELIKISNSSTDQLEYAYWNGSAYAYQVRATALFRDTTNWYHVVIAADTTQSTASNRVKFYVNGTQLTDFSISSYPSEDADTQINHSVDTRIGSGIGGNYFDGYMAEVNFIDGSQLAPTSFGETKNGAWIPKDTSGLTFGTNGYRLQFKQTGTGTASTSTIGADTANSNHFTSNNLSAHDSNMPDSPENNFATLLQKRSGENASSQTFSEGNLQWTSSAYGYNSTGSSINIPTSGKWYFEVYVKTHGTGESHDFGVGLQGVKLDSMSKTDPATATYGDSTHYITRRDFGSRIEKNLGNVYIGTNPGTGTPDEDDSTVNYNAGKIVQVAFDADSGKVYWGLDNTYWDDDVSTDGNPSSGTNETTSLTTGVEYFLTLQQYSNTYVTVTNFGQDSSFAGNKTAQGNKDTNDIGDFYYAVPTGYQALCSANLPEPTISPNADTQATDHFNTFLFSGDGNNPRTLAHGLNFTPDWIWQKNRSSSWYHRLVDSSRGYAKDLFTNVSNAEEASNSGGDITAVDATNMTLQGSSHNNDINGSGENFVMWNWKANGGTTTTNDASATSVGTIDSVYQANTTAGFSIVTYTGTGSAGSIAHGLGGTPEVMIIKNRSEAHSWSGTYHHKMASDPETDYLNLSGTSGVVDDSTIWNDTAPTSTVFTVGTASNTGSSDNFVGYFFRGISGYSKFGSYIGNGSADGPYVHLGFRPAWLMVKEASASGEDWMMWDNKRATHNEVFSHLYANTADDEQGTSGGSTRKIDFLSNGFKTTVSHDSTNTSGNTYIYMAFAEMPEKYSNAR